ncbi:MAG: hypothetical protein D8M58_17740 [Calditrichaeota bacterium]|nr:MAG: hypothetical protein DWQ03_01655 [Calditrichota bacterium]MBL1207250.1 hypothetical protein [Calditrichota bacterium]NOG47083.1 hypothetical protein [Calditrichota bacterium]
MKLIINLLIMLSTQLILAGEIRDKEVINETIKIYIEGQRTDNQELIKKVFHSDANLKFISIRDNEYKIISIERYLTFFSNKKEREFEENIFYIDIVGTAANVKLSLKYETFQYTHYMNMLKTGEGWKIVNKITCQENF